MATGTIEIDFGATPANEATVLVSSGIAGLSIGSHKEAFAQGDDTTVTNPSAESHRQLAFSAKFSCEFVSSTSMRIYCTLTVGMASDKFLIHWVTL